MANQARIDRAFSSYDPEQGVLDLSESSVNEPDVLIRVLESLCELDGLQALILADNPITENGAKLIADSPNVQRLKMLNLRGACIGDDGARHIARSKNLSGLVEINLSQNEIYNSGARHIALSRVLTKIAKLSLCGNEIGFQGAVDLSRSTNLQTLESLDLSSNRIPDKGAIYLAHSSHLVRLVELDLWNNGLRHTASRAIASSEALQGLRFLNLGCNDIRDLGFGYLAHSSHLRALHTLHLEHCVLYPASARYLAESDSLTSIRVLNLHGNRLDQRAAWHIADASILNNLTTLHLGQNRLGSDGVTYIAESDCLNSLAVLGLRSNSIGIAGAEAISSAINLASLESLDLSCNRIGTDGMVALARGKQFVSLKYLDLEKNEIGPEGAEALANATHLASLHTLNLNTNPIRDRGVSALARAQHLSSLQTLGLRGTRVWSTGVEPLVNAKQLKSLKTLDLRNNEIHGDVSLAVSLVKAEQFSSLTTLKLFANGLGEPWDSTEDAAELRVFAKSLTDPTPVLMGKVALVGRGRVGKSFLRQRLEGKEEVDEDEDSTHNIRIADFDLKATGPKRDQVLKLRCFDHGGQRELVSAHRFSLSTERVVYLLVLDATRRWEQNDMETWARYLAFHAPGAPVLVVATQCHHETDERVLEKGEDLRVKIAAVFEQIAKEFKGVGGAPPWDWVDGVDTCLPGAKSNVEAVREKLRALFGDHRDLIWKKPYPPAFIKVMKEVEGWFAIEPELTADEYERLGNDKWKPAWENPFAGMRDEHTKRLKMRWETMTTFTNRVVAHKQSESQAPIYAKLLHELGIAHFAYDRVGHQPEKQTRLFEALVNPEWLKWPVYRVIRSKSIREDKFLHSENLARVVEPIVPEEAVRHDVRLLMRAYGLLAEVAAPLGVSHGAYDLVIDHIEPVPEGVDSFSGWSLEEAPVVVRMDFPLFLPPDLLPRLIGAWRKDYAAAEPEVVWRTAFACCPPVGPMRERGEPALIQADVADRQMTVQMKKGRADRQTLDAIYCKLVELLRPELAWDVRELRELSPHRLTPDWMRERVEEWMKWEDVNAKRDAVPQEVSTLEIEGDQSKQGTVLPSTATGSLAELTPRERKILRVLGDLNSDGEYPVLDGWANPLPFGIRTLINVKRENNGKLWKHYQEEKGWGLTDAGNSIYKAIKEQDAKKN